MSVPSAGGKALTVFRCNVVDAGHAMIALACEAETAAIANEFYDAMSMSVLSSVPFSSRTIHAAPEVKVITGQGAINTYIRIQMGGKKGHRDILEHMNHVGMHLAEDFNPHIETDSALDDGVTLVREATEFVARAFRAFGLPYISGGPAVHVLLLPASFKTENLAALYIYGGSKTSGYILVSQSPSSATDRRIRNALLTGLTACYCDFVLSYAPDSWNEVMARLRNEAAVLVENKKLLQKVPIVNLFAQCRKKEFKREIMERLDITAKMYRPLTGLIINRVFPKIEA